jgi:glycosyltransferase involved in cell wall biosynthesis
MKPAGAQVTVGLAMIVKNEALTLPRLAASLDGQLDHWTIVDTGSTDNTIEVARSVFAGVPGEVIEAEWNGYGPSRNIALKAAQPNVDFVMTLDADDTFIGTIDRRIAPEFDGAEAEYLVHPLRFWVPRLVRSSLEWEWRGRAHEYLTRVDAQAHMARSSSFQVEHHADGGNRATKFERELALLQEDHRENPENPRTVFYLARTYDDGAEFARAATWYRTRIRLGGWIEETWYATWRLGACLVASGKTDEGCGVLWRAWSERSWRVEPLWTLAEHYRKTSQWQLCFEVCQLARKHCGVGSVDPGNGFQGDRLFVHTDAYQWRMAYEESICAYYVNERALGLRLIDELSARSDLPLQIMDSVISNRKFYADS